MVLEEDVNINVKIKGSEEVLNFVKGYNKQIKTTQSMSYEETKEKSRVFNNLKREASLLTNIYKARGENLKALVKYNAEQDRYEVQTEKINTQNDRQKGKLDNLIKRYRWLQSFFLVTQNFVSMLGNSVKAFGAGIKLLLAPFILLLNLALIPALPYIKDIATWALEGVKAFKSWQDENELLADALGVTLFGAIILVTGLGFLGWIGNVIGSIAGLTGLTGMGAAADTAAAAVGTTATTGLAGALLILGGVIGGLALGGFILNIQEVRDALKEVGDASQSAQESLLETFGVDPSALEKFKTVLGYTPLGAAGNAVNQISDIMGRNLNVLTDTRMNELLSSGTVTGGGVQHKLENILGEGSVMTGSGNASGYWYNGGNGAPQQLTSMSQVYNISMQSSATDLSGLSNDITTKQRLLGMERGG